MNDIEQYQYELICENLGVNPYLGDDECEWNNDIRFYSLGEILVIITDKLKEG